MRKHENVDVVADIQESITNKNARIAAKKLARSIKRCEVKELQFLLI